MARLVSRLLPLLYLILSLLLGTCADVCAPPNPVTVTVTVTGPGGYGSKSQVSYSPSTLSTSKAHCKVHLSSCSKSTPYYPAGNKTLSALPTKGASNPPKTNTTCEPTLQLVGVSDHTFNKKNTAF